MARDKSPTGSSAASSPDKAGSSTTGIPADVQRRCSLSSNLNQSRRATVVPVVLSQPYRVMTPRCLPVGLLSRAMFAAYIPTLVGCRSART